MGRAGFEGEEPGADFVSDGRDLDASVAGGAEIEAAQGAAKKGARSGDVAAMEMVEGRGHLNEGLKEALLGLGELEP